jgi:hypothetical protein
MTIPSIPDPGKGVSVAFGIRTKVLCSKIMNSFSAGVCSSQTCSCHPGNTLYPDRTRRFAPETTDQGKTSAFATNFW